jgi:hypothetical protein
MEGEMADVPNGDLGNILNFLSATAAPGTAAMGFVDSTKAFNGGPSNFGFGYIEQAVSPFLVADAGAPTAFGRAEILRTLKANRLNGVATADQKAKAKSLIHLRLTQGNAGTLAIAAGVDATALTQLAQAAAAGTAPTPAQINVLGQFDAVVSAVLDAAYERADQKYRNTLKLLAMLISTILGAVGGWIVYGHTLDSAGSVWSYFHTSQFGIALVVGLVATPLAPVAKNLATSLQAAVSAVRTVKR